MVLAFMALAVPLIVAALGLASTLSIDSGIKTRLAKGQYSAMAGTQHALYRLEYEAGYADGLNVGVPTSYDITMNEKLVSITVEKFSSPPSTLPPPTADNSRRLQVSKVVTPTTAAPYTPTTFTYTITIWNRDDQPEQLRHIYDELPPGFTYVPGSSSGITTDEPSVSGQDLDWNLAPHKLQLRPWEYATLVFSAQANVATGNYCNEAWVDPGLKLTSTGKIVKVRVGSPPNDLCEGPALEVYKSVTPNLAPAYTATTYGYTITLKSVGTAVLNVSQVRDWLPTGGFTYVLGSTSGDITSADPNSTVWQNRNRLDWSFSPKFQIQPGATLTLSFQAQASAAPGEYYNEVWVTTDELPYAAYTWPTATVRVMAVFTITATDGETTAHAEVWVLPGSYLLTQFDVSR